MLKPFAVACCLTAACLVPAISLPGNAYGTTPQGVSPVVLSKRIVDGRDYIVTDLTVAPNDSTGRHTHRGEIYGIVKAALSLITTAVKNLRQCPQPRLRLRLIV
jgi:hypothetical protein